MSDPDYHNKGRPHIENSDRGITLNKSLAWTILSALAILIWWGGATLADLRSSTSMLAEALGENKQANVSVEGRVRVLENGQARGDVQFESLSSSINEIKDLLRDLAKREGQKP